MKTKEKLIRQYTARSVIFSLIALSFFMSLMLLSNLVISFLLLIYTMTLIGALVSISILGYYKTGYKHLEIKEK